MADNIDLETWLFDQYNISSPHEFREKLGIVDHPQIKAVIMFETGNGHLFENVDQAKLSLAKAEFERALRREFPESETQTILDFVESVAAIKDPRGKLGKDQIVIRDFMKGLINGL